jgi:hypothetical protein
MKACGYTDDMRLLLLVFIAYTENCVTEVNRVSKSLNFSVIYDRFNILNLKSSNWWRRIKQLSGAVDAY